MEVKGEVVEVLEIFQLVGTNLVIFSPACFSLVGTKVTKVTKGTKGTKAIRTRKGQDNKSKTGQGDKGGQYKGKDRA